MEKEQIIEQLRKNIFNIINMKEEFTENEIDRLIEKLFYNFLQVYESYGYGFEEIEEYLSGNKEFVRKSLKRTRENRQDELMYEFNHIIGEIEEQIEYNKGETEEEKDEKQAIQRKNIFKIENIDFSNGKNAMEILNALIESMDDVRIRANGILYSREVSDERIQYINLAIRNYINNIEIKLAERINEIFNIEEKDIKSQSIEEYGESVQYLNSYARRERENFIDRLQKGVATLEEQAKFAGNVPENQSKTKIVNPKVANSEVEELPEVII